jgi:hypothetical protein
MGFNGSGSKIQFNLTCFYVCGRWVKCCRGKKCKGYSGIEWSGYGVECKGLQSLKGLSSGVEN